MIKLSIAILLLVEVEPFVCTRLKIKKDHKKTCFKPLDKGRRWKHFNLRVQGLPLTSDGAYD